MRANVAFATFTHGENYGQTDNASKQARDSIMFATAAARVTAGVNSDTCATVETA